MTNVTRELTAAPASCARDACRLQGINPHGLIGLALSSSAVEEGGNSKACVDPPTRAYVYMFVIHHLYKIYNYIYIHYIYTMHVCVCVYCMLFGFLKFQVRKKDALIIDLIGTV